MSKLLNFHKKQKRLNFNKMLVSNILYILRVLFTPLT
jgi:hypothetical protein